MSFGLKEDILSQKLPESLELSKFVSHRARMLGEFDSRKDSNSVKFEERPQICVKLNFRRFCVSRLSGLHPFDNMTIIQNMLKICHKTGR